LKIMVNASDAGTLIPIQLVRTIFHEKGAGGAMIETPFFLCTIPKREISTPVGYLSLDPGFVYGNAEINEVQVTIGKRVKNLSLGEKIKIDFSDGIEKTLNIKVVYNDGFKGHVPIAIRGPEKKQILKNK
jgi:hypothetical protein